MRKPVKSALCHEMEKCLSSADIVQPSKWKSLSTTYLVDVMANVRKISLKGLRTFCRSLLKLLHYIVSHMQECSKNRYGV